MKLGRMLVSVFAMAFLFACGGATDSGTTTEGSSGQEAPKSVLRFSAIPDQNSTELQEKFQPFARYLSDKLGVPVEYVSSRDYQASVEAFKNEDIHLAWFGGLTGVQARNAVQGARAIAQGAADPQYYSYFIASKDSGLERSDAFPEAIGTMPFTFGSESSTSGRLMPEYFIKQETGKSPGEFFAEPFGFSGSHDKTVELVETGQYQVGVVNYKVYDRRVAEGKTDPDAARIIWQTPFYADYNWTAHPKLDEVFGAGFVDRLQQALVGIEDPALLSALPRERLIPATNEEFEGIRLVAVELDMLR